MIEFIGIGAQKAATTWLHHILSEHPGVITSDAKELNFFTANYDRGALWYESQFDDGNGLRGEVSPTYFFSGDAPRRASAYNPDLRVIAVLRDPVERTYSNHLHEVRKRHIPPETSFEVALDANPAYVLQSRYRENLSRWSEVFAPEQILVLLAEEIGSDPLASFRSVCRHLGLPDTPEPEGLHERQHESVEPKNRAIQGALRSLGDFARHRGLGAAVKSVKAMPVVDGLLAANRRSLRSVVADMQPETRARLVEEFRPDAVFVAEWLGRPTLPWRNYEGEVLTNPGPEVAHG